MVKNITNGEMFMPVFKLLNTKGKYYDQDARRDVLRYVIDSAKAPHYVGGYNVNLDYPAESMNEVAKQFGKTNGVQLRHYVISFTRMDTKDASVANCIAEWVADYFVPDYQVVYAVHEDSSYLNIHIVVNSISCVDGHRFSMRPQQYNAFKNYVALVMREFGLRRPLYVSAGYNQG